MKLPTLFISITLVLLALFAWLNWPAFTTLTPLTLGFVDVSAPLGLLMLGATAVVSVLFLAYILFLQAGALLEARRTAKDLHSHRELADKAEASRFTELRAFLDLELRKLEAQGAAAQRELSVRTEQLEQRLQADLSESTRTVAAYLGEIEDKLDRVLPPSRN